ncbi:unnamed protein product [Camellia sinensis]
MCMCVLVSSRRGVTSFGSKQTFGEVVRETKRKKRASEDIKIQAKNCEKIILRCNKIISSGS